MMDHERQRNSVRSTAPEQSESGSTALGARVTDDARRALSALVKPILTLFLLLAPSFAFAQGALIQGGPWVSGHVPVYVGQGGSQAVAQDGGPAGGGGTGVGASEFALTARGTGTAPYAGQGTGPYGTNLCDYDAPTSNPSGYHYFCWSANAQGGGLIAYGAGGGASALPLQFVVNGTVTGLPTVTVPTVAGSPTCFTNTAGNIADCTTPQISVTINGTTCTLQSTCAPTTAASSIKVGTTTITSGTTGYVEYNNAGVLGEIAPTGTGNVVLATSPSIAGLTVTSSFTATGLVTLADIATQAANTALVNATASSASPTAQSMPSCSSSNHALIWTTSTGFGCATITASATSITVGSTTIASGSSGNVEYNNGGTLGELATTGSGNVVLSASPTLTGTIAAAAATLTAASPQLTLGVNTSVAGGIKMFGSSTGNLTLTPAAAAGSSVTVTIPGATDTLVNLASIQSLSNKTLSSPTLSGTTTGPDSGTWTSTGINSAAIGATTASSGAFTTLSATSTVSGTGFSTYLASPPAIGGSSAAAGTFTTLGGTTITATTQLIDNPSGSPVPTFGFTPTLIVNAGSGQSAIVGYGAVAPDWALFEAAGTAASPTAITSGLLMGEFDFGGYDGTAWQSFSSSARIAVTATQNWVHSSAYGNKMAFYTTANNATSSTLALTLNQDQSAVFAGTVTATIANAATTSAVCYNTGTGLFTYDSTIGTCNTSSMRFKHDIRPLRDTQPRPLEAVLKMQPDSFYYNEDQHTEGQQLGLMAEQLAEIDPRLVGYDNDGKPNSIRYLGPMFSYLIGAIQEQEKKIDRLEHRRH